MPTFRTRVMQARVNATGLPVPPEALDELGAGKRPAVVVTVAGYTYRTSVGAMGGQYLIPLSAAHRAASGVAADDDVEVTIELDEQPREAVIPDEVAAPPRRGARPGCGVPRALVEPAARPRGSDRRGQDRRDPRAPRREGARRAARLTPPGRRPRRARHDVGGSSTRRSPISHSSARQTATRVE
ncbi:DUF1905 domain-containing protein [Clavibacter michiganensis]|uniref:DUF1905 domain-containing protein n=1 Tax=Clavibacter michiganensis TaxID=28447 RepID=UPI003F520E2C